MNSNWKKYTLFFLLFIFVFYFKNLFFNKFNLSSEKEANDLECNEYRSYQESCLNLFKYLRYPNLSRIHRPPLRYIPNELLSEFTQNGKIPIKKWLYINEAYQDSINNLKTKNVIISNDDVTLWRNAVKNRLPLNYGDKFMTHFMFKYEDIIKNKKLVVVGTQSVWVEAIGLEVGAAKITTLDYTRKAYEDKNKLEWVHVNDYFDNILNNHNLEEFDSAASFSSLEHSGLGRYGDPLDGNGDINAIRQLHCMVKPGGLLFLGLPTTNPLNLTSYIEFNVHRVYGADRLGLLFNTGWKLLEQSEYANLHTVFVLKKLNTCLEK